MRDTGLDLTSEPWRARGACVGHPLGTAWDGVPPGQDSRHPAVRARIKAAITVCETCPVMVECGAWADRQPDRAVGIIAGGQLRDGEWLRTHPRTVPKGRRLELDPVFGHGTEARAKRHERDGQPPCPACRKARIDAHRKRRQRAAERFALLTGREATG